MKAFTNLLLTLTISLISTTISAQQLKCIICPEQLGISNVESGASIQSLAPIKASAVNQSLARIKASAVNQSEKEVTVSKVTITEFMADVVEIKEEETMGFVSTTTTTTTTTNNNNNLIPTSEDEELCGDPLECGLITAEEVALSEKTFQLYPNPAHHWVVINKDDLGEGDFQITVKDANGSAVKTQIMETQKVTLNLKDFAKGTYFITLRDEATYSEWVQKVNIK
jgi:hypothetical protein